MKVINKVDFVKMFDEKKGAIMLAVSLETVPSMRKTDNPYINGTTKTVSLSGITGFDYENVVNMQLMREGKEPIFDANPLPWGKHDNAYIISNLDKKTGKTKFYVQMKVQGSSDPVYRHNGEYIEKVVLEPFLPKRTMSATQEDVELDKEVVVRTVSVDNIKTVRMGGEEFMLVD